MEWFGSGDYPGIMAMPSSRRYRFVLEKKELEERRVEAMRRRSGK